jgi:transcriptional regulator with XRE-family HTH domain
MFTRSKNRTGYVLKDIREGARVSQNRIARKLNIGTQHVMRIEQGLYDHISPEAAKAYAELSFIQADELSPLARLSPSEVMDLYREDISNRREQLAQRYTDTDWNGFTSSSLSDLRDFLGFDSRISFCKALSVHPAAVINFESGRAKRLPTDLLLALNAIGVPAEITTRITS